MNEETLAKEIQKEIYAPLIDVEYIRIEAQQATETRIKKEQWKQKNQSATNTPSPTSPYTAVPIPDFSGTIDPKFRDSTDARVKIGKYVIVDMPFKSTAFVYTIKATSNGKTFNTHPQVNCKSFSTKPIKPLTKELLRSMLRHAEASKELCDQILAEITPEQFQKELNHVFRVLKSKSGFKFESEEFKRYFLHKQLTDLEAFYPDDLVHLRTMSFERLQKLYNMLKNQPAWLCCSRLNGLKWQIKDADTGKIEETASFKDTVSITELTMEQLQKAKINLTQIEEIWIKVYKYVKNDYYREKHAFTEECLIDMQVETDYNVKDIKAAYKFLLDNLVVVKEQDRIYLLKSYLHEVMISNSIVTLRNRHLKEIPESMKKERLDDWKEMIWTAHTLDEQDQFLEGACDEQTTGIKKAITEPIAVISGPGGSGKSFVAKKIIRHLHNPENTLGVLVTAFQHKNIGALARDMPQTRIFFTTHQLLAAHNRCCHKSPWKKGQEKRDKTLCAGFETCIFERVEYLLVDEAGLEYPAIMAPLLAALVECSPNFKGLIFSGDIGQLPSIQSGNLLKDLKTICKHSFNSFVEFTHNHRVKFDLLFQNAKAITTKQPDLVEFDNKVAIHAEYPKTEDELHALIIYLIKKYNLGPENCHFITFTNELKDKINLWLHQYYIKPPQTADGANYRRKIFYPGSKILIKRNDASEDIVNNEILIINRIFDRTPISTKEIPVASTNAYLSSEVKRYIECKTMYNTVKMMELSQETKECTFYAYATTNYSFIGDQQLTIVDIVPPWFKRETNETRYTAATRAMERYIFIGNQVLNKKAILTPEPARNTSLASRVNQALAKLPDETARGTKRPTQESEETLGMDLVAAPHEERTIIQKEQEQPLPPVVTIIKIIKRRKKAKKEEIKTTEKGIEDTDSAFGMDLVPGTPPSSSFSSPVITMNPKNASCEVLDLFGGNSSEINY